MKNVDMETENKKDEQIKGLVEEIKNLWRQDTITVGSRYQTLEIQIE